MQAKTHADLPSQPMHAVVNGEVLNEVPDDLYIPPEALEVLLETFEGPLDLLLYLIRKQNVDIVQISITRVTQQYMEFIAMMQDLKLELAADYLVMAATLAEIKSRVLLPRPVQAEEEDLGLDPRAALIKRLQEYERYKNAAEQVDELPRQGRDWHSTRVGLADWALERAQPPVTMAELLVALREVYARAKLNEHHHIEAEPLSVRERMTSVLEQLRQDSFSDFRTLFPVEEGRAGVVVTFLALLELAKEHMIELVQADLFTPIHVKAV